MRRIPAFTCLLLWACADTPDPSPAPPAPVPEETSPAFAIERLPPLDLPPAPAVPRAAHQLAGGITPSAPAHVRIAERPAPAPLPSSGEALSAGGPVFSRGGKPALPFCMLDAPADTAALLGADFMILPCPHASARPAITPAGRDEAAIAYPDLAWAAHRAAGAARAGIAVSLAFEGPLGDMEPFGRLLPDIAAPAESLPFSPLHPFGARLYAEYLKTYLAASREAQIFLVQPAGPLSPLGNDLETWKAFRRDAERKYAGIDRANAAWGTRFEGFWEVLPPGAGREAPPGTADALDPLRGDWLDYLWESRRDLALALAGLVRDLAGGPGPLVAVRSADPLALHHAAAAADAAVFDAPLRFLPDPMPLTDAAPLYLAELARSAGKPIADIGGYTAPPETPPWQQAALLRHFIWRRCWHGASALALPPAGRVLAAAPRFMAEARAVFPILAARGEDPAPIVLLHPTETLRPLPAERRSEALAHIVAWWQAFAARGVNVAVVPSEKLRLQDLQRARAVLCPLAFVVNDTTFALIEQFARDGGVVVTEWGAFAKRDGAGRGRETRRFLGLQVVMAANVPPAARLSTGEEIDIAPRPLDGARGASVELLLAEPYGPRVGRLPVGAVNRCGQGYVYTVLVSLPERTRDALLRAITADHGIGPDISVATADGRDADRIEAGLRSAGGKRIAVLFNLGPPRRFVLAFTAPVEGAFSLRDTLTGALLHGPSGAATWGGNDLRQGLQVFLDRGETAAVLIERANDPAPLAFPGIALRRREMLARLDRDASVGPRVLTIDQPSDPFSHATARAVLARAGFRSAPLRAADDLKTSAAAWVDHRTPRIDARELLQFVARGGGLLIEAAPPPGEEPSPLIRDLLSALRCETGPRVTASVSAASGRTLPVVPLGIARHDATAGVGTVVLPYACALQAYPRNAQILVHGTEEVTPVGVPIIAAFSHEAGRVVIVGGCGWATPLALELGDNARFLAACVRHLAGLSSPLLDDRDLADCLFITRVALAQARAEDGDPARTTFLPYEVAGMADPFPRPEEPRGPYWATFSPLGREAAPERTPEAPPSR
ncbi:MAG TPA: hypothetical protein DCM87_09470 [Planctomycetes bacterium]|nr:hypothetical protein [Planctomycetota bacterium]